MNPNVPNVPGLPEFRVPRKGMSLTVIPPFPFEGMTVRSFPLRANLSALQRFCDAYLNFIPPELGRFRAMAPYVQLMLVDYGKMATKVRNVGWIAQREVLFSIPLTWYKVVNGRWEFHDWATIAPFIYVDDDMSMATGRTVYGWPKTIAHLTPTLGEWMRDPLAPTTDATVSTMVFPELYSGCDMEERVFLEVKNSGALANFTFPPGPHSPLTPWAIATNLATAMAGIVRDSAGLLAASGVWPLHQASTPDNLNAMMGKCSEMGFMPRPNLVSNTINLKQFRRSEKPEEYCYQAVTNGPIRFTGFNRAGLLGEQRAMLGDPSGGYSITLHQWPSLPIVETLGLEVADRWRGDGCDVVRLKPVMPLWYDVDMEYMGGSNVAWRARDGRWRDADGRAYPLTVATTAASPSAEDDVAAVDDTDRLFNTTLGASQIAVAGPFRFADTTIRVLPLLAERRTLQTFLDEFLNGALRHAKPVAGDRQFRVWAPEEEEHEFAYVYLTASRFDDVESPTNNIGDWAKFEVQYLVPVRHEKWCVEEGRPEGEWQLQGVGVVPALTQVDNSTAAASNAEVLGIPTERATFVEPESVWMQPRGPMPEALQSLLRVMAEVSPVIGEGQKTVVREVLEIREGVIADDTLGQVWRVTADRWAAMLRGELQRKKQAKALAPDVLKNARALALELLGNRVPISAFTLKQVRDVGEPMRACYQSLVRVQRTLSDVRDVREIETPLIVRLHEYPTSPIKSLLGLVAKPLQEHGAGILWALQPVRPFWILATVEESLGECLMSRAAGHKWVVSDSPPTEYFLEETDTEAAKAVNGILHRGGDPRRLARALNDVQALRNAGQALVKGLSREQARRAVEQFDPQSVIETMLSREWGNWDEQARWQRGSRELEVQLTARLEAAPQDRLSAAALAFYDDTADSIQLRPGRERPSRFDELMRTQRKDVEEKCSGVEMAWTELCDAIKAGMPTSSTGDGPREKFWQAIARLSEMQLTGASNLPDSTTGRSSEAILARLGALAKKELAGSKPSAGLTKAGKEAITLCRELSALQRRALLNWVSLLWQKPDFVVRRDAAGPDRERHFPRAQSWDDDWYAGPPLSKSEPSPPQPPKPPESKSLKG